MQSPLTEAAGRPADLPFELESLARATNYQQWMFRAVEPYLGRRIMEIGAGIGNMSRWLPVHERLIVTEFDPALLKVLERCMQERVGGDPRVVARSLDMLKDDLEEIERETLDT